MSHTILIRAKAAIPFADNPEDFPPLTYDIYPAQLTCFLGARFSILNRYLRLLAGIEKTYSGEVLHFLCPFQSHFPHVAYLNCHSTLLSVLSGIENVKLPALYHQLGTREKVESKAFELLNEMQYGADHSILPAFMSMLQKRHLLIARAIMLEPKVLFIENPFTGLELAEMAILADYLASLVKQKNITVITSNAHLDFVEHYAQQIIYVTEQAFHFFTHWHTFWEYKQQHRLKF